MRQRVQQLRELRNQRRRAQELKSEIEAELEKDRPDRELLKQKLAEFAETRAARKREKQLVLRHRLGEAASRDDVKQELARHGKTLARIERLKFLASSERTGAARKRLLDRLQKVSEREEQRHQKALTELAPNAAMAAPSAAPSGAHS
jgi:hypothetical protein